MSNRTTYRNIDLRQVQEALLSAAKLAGAYYSLYGEKPPMPDQMCEYHQDPSGLVAIPSIELLDAIRNMAEALKR